MIKATCHFTDHTVLANPGLYLLMSFCNTKEEGHTTKMDSAVVNLSKTVVPVQKKGQEASGALSFTRMSLARSRMKAYPNGV